MEKVIIQVVNGSMGTAPIYSQEFGSRYQNIQRGDIVKGFRDYKSPYVLYCVSRQIDLENQTLIIRVSSLPYDSPILKV